MDDDTYIDDLNQILRAQRELVKQFERIRKKQKGDEADDLTRIQADVRKTLREIDEIRKRAQYSKTKAKQP